MATSKTVPCEACGEGTARKRTERQEFAYGTGADSVTLTANVPVWTCDTCAMAYTDQDGEDAQHEAVCHHLGRLAPSEIREVRATAGLSQAQFAKELRVGVASVKRWETGAVIQNAAANADMQDFLRRTRRVHLPTPRFRTQLAPEKLAAAPLFRLRAFTTGRALQPVSLAA